jgi:hypothetical protein
MRNFTIAPGTPRAGDWNAVGKGLGWLFDLIVWAPLTALFHGLIGGGAVWVCFKLYRQFIIDRQERFDQNRSRNAEVKAKSTAKVVQHIKAKLAKFHASIDTRRIGLSA